MIFTVWIDPVLFISSSVDEHLGCCMCLFLDFFFLVVNRLLF